MDRCETVRIKAENPEEQGEFIVINADEFDAERHELYVEAAADVGLTVAQLKQALTDAGIEIPADAKKAQLQEMYAAYQATL